MVGFPPWMMWSLPLSQFLSSQVLSSIPACISVTALGRWWEYKLQAVYSHTLAILHVCTHFPFSLPSHTLLNCSNENKCCLFLLTFPNRNEMLMDQDDWIFPVNNKDHDWEVTQNTFPHLWWLFSLYLFTHMCNFVVTNIDKLGDRT